MQACSNARDAFLKCMRESECMTKDHHTYHECMQKLKDGDPSVDQNCHALANTLYICKKSQLDQRLRFRGRNRDIEPEEMENKPPSLDD